MLMLRYTHTYAQTSRTRIMLYDIVHVYQTHPGPTYDGHHRPFVLYLSYSLHHILSL